MSNTGVLTWNSIGGLAAVQVVGNARISGYIFICQCNNPDKVACNNLRLYAPGKLTVAGEALPPPEIAICAHSI